MLNSLQVRDFAIVEKIDIEFDRGMTVLTGETGAGKSILIDALGLVLGERGGARLVRDGAKRAEFAAEFDVSAHAEAAAWLTEHALDEDNECLLRRVVNADGRSRAFINGNAVPLAQLKSIGEMLLDIHGQHFHQSLGKRDVQRDLLDFFGGLQEQRAAVGAAYAAWTAVAERVRSLRDAESDRAARLDLLTFQVQELEALAVGGDEVLQLKNERQKLQNGSRLVEGLENASSALIDSESANANRLIAEASRAIESLLPFDPELSSVAELITSAGIQITEAAETLRRYGENIDMDPARRDWVEERLDAFHASARKHRVDVDDLHAVQAKLSAELEALQNADTQGRELEKQSAKLHESFIKAANVLSTARHEAARAFSIAVTNAMEGLGMPGGEFKASLSKLDDDGARPWGVDNIDFLISANPGQKLQSLAKIASGGELSRMSLAIQVIASDGSSIPTMVFDEVDSGVGGGVAEMVGRRLQEIGGSRQVLCVTHLPQVASLADQHVRISKVSDGKSTRTGLSILGKKERTEELARMLGGVDITQKTLDHAAEMLAGGHRKRA